MILIATQCFPPDRGGIEALMGGLADALAASGHEVAVYADRARDGGAKLVTPYPVKRFGGFKPLRRRLKARAVARAAKAARIEGVFADSWKSVELLGDVGAPIVVLAHGMEFPARPSARKKARITQAFAKAKTVIANSAYTASLAKPYVGEKTRLVVINPPIGPLPKALANADVREVVVGHNPVLLTLARLEPRKGVDMVIGALPRVLQVHPNAVYIVAGAGDDRGRLEQIARDENVDRRVRFVGAVDGSTKAALFAAADVFVMPARREGDSVEGFGIVYLEAAWYGVPALAGRDGGAVDAVRDGETGLLCNASDQNDVTRQIMRLLDDDALRVKLGTAASARARGPAQWSNAITAFLDALK